LKFSIVILSFNQPDQTVDCIKSIQAVKSREFPDKQIFIVHNGSEAAVIQDLRTRYPRFHHVVLNENEGFAAGANAGIRAAFQLESWVLMLTQDTTLVHFPKGPPFEPCMAAVKIYKRNTEIINSMGGAVDLDLAKHYYCMKADNFWNSFENSVLQPFIPRTAFWIHQGPFEKVNGFDETLGSIWEDVDISIRLREEGELLQLDESTEIIHHRKGNSRRDPLQTRYMYNRNRFAISRRKLRNRGQSILFEIGLFAEWFLLYVKTLLQKPKEASLIFRAYRASFARPLIQPYLALQPDSKPSETPEAEPESNDKEVERVSEKKSGENSDVKTGVTKNKGSHKSEAKSAEQKALDLQSSLSTFNVTKTEKEEALGKTLTKSNPKN